MKLATLTLAALAAMAATAAMIPQEWAVEVSRVKQYQFQANRGDTMELKATFWHNGEPFDLGGDTFRLYWQTNGMDSVYWSAAAASASNTVSAVFANTMDPGAPIVYGFLGATSGNYRASFAIRYAPGPGAVPNALPLPAPVIDFATVEVLNPPWTKEIESLSVEVESNRVDIASLTDTTATINSKIPSAASQSNQLADKEWIDDEIDTYAAYYITYTATGAAFPTRAALLNATVVYSGGVARTPTRNDYAVVLADETHGGAEWRYIYAVADGATTGQWEAQYPIETNDYEALANKPQINGNELFGNKTGAQLGLATPDDVAAALSNAITPSNTTFSNAVLSVGLNIDTNTVAAINGLVDSAHDLPVSGASSVGALLLALAAAVAALKKKLAYEIVSPAVTVANGAETCQLVDRAVNSVTLATSAFAPAFPASPGAGRARDFFVRITAASDVTLTLPAGVTVENAAGDIPAIEGGATTILYFSEVAANRFLLKGEAVEAVT